MPLSNVFLFLLLVFLQDVEVHELNHTHHGPSNDDQLETETSQNVTGGSATDFGIELAQASTELNETEGEIVNITAYNNMLNDTWLNLVTVMDLFTQREYDNSSAVQALTAAYRYTLKKQTTIKTLPTYLKKPFIVVEGLDRQKRATLANRLALHLQGHMVPNPPNTYETILNNLPSNSSILKNGFYVLSTYVAALHVRYVVQKAPAIVPGYWLGRAALSIARNFILSPPPYESKFWTWPRDLVKPDVVFYITDRYSLHQFDDYKLVKRYLHVFDNWIDPKCIPLVHTQSVETMMEEIEPYLQQL